MSLDETIRSAIEVLDGFYKDTAAMLETLKGILINDYDYEDMSGNKIHRRGSSSIKKPLSWSPSFLSISLIRNKNEYISVAVPMKEVFGKKDQVRNCV